MKKTGIFLLLILFLLQLSPISAQAAATGSCNTLQADRALAGSEVYTGTAKAVILYELNTGTLVYAHNPDESINPTGLIKLLSALIVLEEGNLDDVVTVSRNTLNSVGAGAVSAGLKAGEQITLRDLLYCVMVSSANDAAAVMAEHIAGTQAEFVEKMNARAATAGCVNTRFTNVHGLKDDRQYSTARDLAVLVEIALQNEQFREMFAVTRHTVPATNMSTERNLSTTNFLMDPSSQYYDERVTGGKPAAASTADRSVICTAQSGDSSYLCVIISAKARTSGSSVMRYTNFDEATKLLSRGFDGYAIQQVLGTQQPFGIYPVSGGENDVTVGPDTEVFALLPMKFEPEKLQLVDVPNGQALQAPLSEGTAVGTLQIYYDSILIGQAMLLARHDVALQGTTIQLPDDANGSNGAFGRILKWFGVVVLVLGISTVVVLIVIRQINVSRRRAHTRRAKQRRAS